jgi:hypothetical protein
MPDSLVRHSGSQDVRAACGLFPPGVVPSGACTGRYEEFAVSMDDVFNLVEGFDRASSLKAPAGHVSLGRALFAWRAQEVCFLLFCSAFNCARPIGSVLIGCALRAPTLRSTLATS